MGREGCCSYVYTSWVREEITVWELEGSFELSLDPSGILNVASVAVGLTDRSGVFYIQAPLMQSATRPDTVYGLSSILNTASW